MSIVVGDDARRVIPRWREARVAAAVGDLEPARNEAAVTSVDRTRGLAELDDLLSLFAVTPSTVLASEIVSSAYVLGEFERGRAAAEHLLSKRDLRDRIVSTVARRVAGLESDAHPVDVDSLTGGGEQGHAEQMNAATLGRRIAATRVRVARDYRNSFAWTDLSRLYASIGQVEKARRAMLAAVSLAPTNRFVIRSATRFFVHSDEADRASDILRRTGALTRDPWLLAADVAVGSVRGVTSKHIARGRSLLSSGDFETRHLSELAGAIGTIEALAGERRRAQRRFRQALEAPTENVVAQAEFMMRVKRLIDTDEQMLLVPDAYEAQAWRAFGEKDYQRSLNQSWEWLADEPFSGRAAGLGTLLAAVALEDAEAARQIGEAGLLAHPGRPELLNNIAFALADAGRLVEADEMRARLPSVQVLAGASAVAWRATAGLLAFRRGEIEQGRSDYQEALSLAEKDADQSLALQVIAYWAAEESRHGTPHAAELEALVRRGAERIADARSPYMALILARLARTRERFSKA